MERFKLTGGKNMYKILIIHNIFIINKLYGHIETNLELPFPPFKELSIRKDGVETDLSYCWEGPTFDITKGQFEFIGQTRCQTKEEAEEKIKTITKSENYKFFSNKESES